METALPTPPPAPAVRERLGRGPPRLRVFPGILRGLAGAALSGHAPAASFCCSACSAVVLRVSAPPSLLGHRLPGLTPGPKWALSPGSPRSGRWPCSPLGLLQWQPGTGTCRDPSLSLPAPPRATEANRVQAAVPTTWLACSRPPQRGARPHRRRPRPVGSGPGSSCPQPRAQLPSSPRPSRGFSPRELSGHARVRCCAGPQCRVSAASAGRGHVCGPGARQCRRGCQARWPVSKAAAVPRGHRNGGPLPGNVCLVQVTSESHGEVDVCVVPHSGHR